MREGGWPSDVHACGTRLQKEKGLGRDAYCKQRTLKPRYYLRALREEGYIHEIGITPASNFDQAPGEMETNQDRGRMGGRTSRPQRKRRAA